MRYFKALIRAKRKDSWDRTKEEKKNLFWFKIMVELGFLVGIYLFAIIVHLIMEVF